MYLPRIRQIIDKPDLYWGKVNLTAADRLVRLQAPGNQSSC
jgi:hypothetical protein